MAEKYVPNVLLDLSQVVAMQAGSQDQAPRLPIITITFRFGGAVSLPFSRVSDRDSAMVSFAKALPKLNAL